MDPGAEHSLCHYPQYVKEVIASNDNSSERALGVSAGPNT